MNKERRPETKQAGDRLDGILEIYEADDECVKQVCLSIEKPFVFISSTCQSKSMVGAEGWVAEAYAEDSHYEMDLAS